MPSFHMTENISCDFIWEDLDLPSHVNPSLNTVLARNGTSRAQLRASQYVPKSKRKIAGNKRVDRYRSTQGHKDGDGRVFQSITATPALNHASFEELRVDCYLQSSVAKGRPPSPVDPVKTPWAVIPPVFNAFKDTSEDDNADSFLSQVIMKD